MILIAVYALCVVLNAICAAINTGTAQWLWIGTTCIWFIALCFAIDAERIRRSWR